MNVPSALRRVLSCLLVSLVAIGAASLQAGCDRKPKPGEPPKPSQPEPAPPRPQTTPPGTLDPSAPASPPPSTPSAKR